MRLLARKTIAVTATLVVGAVVVPSSSSAAFTTAWRRDAGRELRSVAVDGAGNAYVTGYVVSGARRLDTLYVAKYGPDGTRRWFDTWRPAGGPQSVGNDIAIGPDGRIFVAGTVRGDTDDGPTGWFVRAYGPGGEARWHRDQKRWRRQTRRSAALGIGAGGEVVAIAVTTEGGGGFHDGLIRAFGPDGAARWHDPFEVPGFATHDRATDVAVDAAGAVFAIGEVDQKRITADRPVVDQEIVVQRLGARTGDVRWIRMFRDRGGRDADLGTAVEIRGEVLAVAARVDGGPVTGPRAERGHAWAARLGTSAGSIVWEREWGEANRRAAEPEAIAIGPGGTIHVAGTLRGGDDGVDAFVRSLGADGARRGWARLRSGRFLHGTGTAAGGSGGRVWVTAWRGARDTDLPDGGRLWLLRP